MNPEELEYHPWRGVVGWATECWERPSIQNVKAWVWKNGPCEVEGVIFERMKVRFTDRAACPDEPDCFAHCQGYVRDKGEPHFYMFSVPNPNNGYSDPFDNYMPNAERITDLYAMTAKDLCTEVLERVAKKVTAVRNQYNLALLEQIQALNACSPFLPEVEF